MSGTNPPSSASYANYVTAETVKYYDNASEVSSAKGSSSFMARSFNNSSLKRWILFLSLGFLLYLLFCIIYQATQGIYLSYDARNSRTLDSGTSEESVQAFINAHLPNRIGLWKQCSDSTGCIDLQLWCDRDEIGERLRSAGLLVKANADEEKEFIDQEAQLCPMYIASRTVSLLALFFGVMTVVGLWFAFKRNSNGSYLTAVFGAFFSAVLSAVTLGLLVNIKNILDNLSGFGSKYSASGSNTENPFVDTLYSYNFGFWLVLVAFLIAALLLPLFFILSHQARQYRQNRSSAHYYGSEYGSSFSFSSNDGPVLPPKGSKEPLRSPSYLVRETTQNVTYNNPNLSYDMPPVSGATYDAATRRYVRFDGNQAVAGATTTATVAVTNAANTATNTVTTTVTKQIVKEDGVVSPRNL